jgi:hypothetical protein
MVIGDQQTREVGKRLENVNREKPKRKKHSICKKKGKMLISPEFMRKLLCITSI